MRRAVPVFSLLAVVVLVGTLSACSVPVFRYALEHWQADPYLAVVFHRGELSEQQQAVITRLQPQGDEGRPAANLMVQTVDLDSDPDEAMLALWEEQTTETLPWMVVAPPARQGALTTVWAGTLEASTVGTVLESPSAKSISDGLLSGDSMVWVCLDSGDAEADQAAFDVLTAEVERLQNELELPEIDEADLDDLSLDPAALQLKMSTVRVSRDNPADAFLVQSLLRVEPDLRDEPFASQPMVFPVFGRGRALYALVGPGITPDTIEEAGRFLTGGCQCTVKAQNPGVDLLMSVDWDRHIQPSLPYDDSQPELAGLASFVPPESSSTNGDPSTVEPPEAQDDGPAEVTDVQELTVPEPEIEASTTADVKVPETGSPEAGSSVSSTSLNFNVFLVIGVLAMCVIGATLVLLPRSR